MKLLGIDAVTRQLRWPLGSPYHCALWLKDANGAAQDLGGRDFAMTIFRGSAAIVSNAGSPLTNDDGDYVRFDFAGTVPGLIGAAGATASWEIAELYSDGKAVLLTGPVYVAAAAPSGAGDGSYPTSSEAEELAWRPDAQTLVITERGARGPGADDPGDLTLIFDNGLI